KLDLSAALVDVASGAVVDRAEEAVLAGAPADGQVAGGLAAGVEMLMPGLILGHERGARSPVDPLALAGFVPVQGVAGAADDDHIGAGAMPMSLLVGPDRKLGD